MTDVDTPESSCCQEDGYSCGPFDDMERERDEAAAREMRAWAERDQYLQSNVKLLALVRDLRDALESIKRCVADKPESTIYGIAERALTAGERQS